MLNLTLSALLACNKWSTPPFEGVTPPEPAPGPETGPLMQCADSRVPGACGYTCDSEGIEGLESDFEWQECTGYFDRPVVEYEGCLFRIDVERWMPHVCLVDEPLEAVCRRLPGASGTETGCPTFTEFLDQLGWHDENGEHQLYRRALRCLAHSTTIPYDEVSWVEPDPPPDADPYASLTYYAIFDGGTGELVSVTRDFFGSSWEYYCCGDYGATFPVWGHWFDLICEGPGTWVYDLDGAR